MPSMFREKVERKNPTDIVMNPALISGHLPFFID